MQYIAYHILHALHSALYTNILCIAWYIVCTFANVVSYTFMQYICRITSAQDPLIRFPPLIFCCFFVSFIFRLTILGHILEQDCQCWRRARMNAKGPHLANGQERKGSCCKPSPTSPLPPPGPPYPRLPLPFSSLPKLCVIVITLGPQMWTLNS